MKEARQKAEQLIEKFAPIMPNENWRDKAIECALITVQECIDTTPMYTGNLNPKWKFWDDVKKELKQL